MSAERIRAQVLRGLALNRAPGLHFAGHFNEVSFDSIDGSHARVTVDSGVHNVDRDGQLGIGVVAMVADMALASSIRAGLDPKTRLATVSMALQFSGTRIEGPLEARGEFTGFYGGGESRHGMARVAVAGSAGSVCHGHGAFMSLEPPPGVALHPLPHGRRNVAALAEEDLSAEELRILRHAEATLASGGTEDFLRRLWGFQARRTKAGASAAMKNGAHVANRVHHVQGGLLMGLAAATATAALPPKWGLTSISACFVSPGQGPSIRARSKIVHHGLMTGVVRTELLGPGNRRVLEAITTHSRT